MFTKVCFGTKNNFSKFFVHMSCMWMRENGEFVQVAVKGALTQLVQKVVEKLLVAALYSSKCFVLMKEIDHFEQRNSPEILGTSWLC